MRPLFVSPTALTPFPRLSDLIFGVPKLVSFLSQGTTLKAGTLILTGVRRPRSSLSFLH